MQQLIDAMHSRTKQLIGQVIIIIIIIIVIILLITLQQHI